MCGGASGTIFLVTTAWDDGGIAEVKLRIEGKIKTDWGAAIAEGAQYRRFDNKAGSAESIIRELLAVKPVVNTNEARPVATPVEEVMPKKTFLCFQMLGIEMLPPCTAFKPSRLVLVSCPYGSDGED